VKNNFDPLLFVFTENVIKMQLK